MTYLEGKGAELTKHDLAKDPPTRTQLETWIDGSRLHDFINKRSPAYKNLGLGDRELTKNEAIDLMMEEPNLIRRPIVVRGKHVHFGRDETAFEALLKT